MSQNRGSLPSAFSFQLIDVALIVAHLALVFSFAMTASGISRRMRQGNQYVTRVSDDGTRIRFLSGYEHVTYNLKTGWFSSYRRVPEWQTHNHAEFLSDNLAVGFDSRGGKANLLNLDTGEITPWPPPSGPVRPLKQWDRIFTRYSAYTDGRKIVYPLIRFDYGEVKVIDLESHAISDWKLSNQKWDDITVATHSHYFAVSGQNPFDRSEHCVIVLDLDDGREVFVGNTEGLNGRVMATERYFLQAISEEIGEKWERRLWKIDPETGTCEILNVPQLGEPFYAYEDAAGKIRLLTRRYHEGRPHEVIDLDLATGEFTTLFNVDTYVSNGDWYNAEPLSGRLVGIRTKYSESHWIYDTSTKRVVRSVDGLGFGRMFAPLYWQGGFFLVWWWFAHRFWIRPRERKLEPAMTAVCAASFFGFVAVCYLAIIDHRDYVAVGVLTVASLLAIGMFCLPRPRSALISGYAFLLAFFPVIYRAAGTFSWGQ